MTSSARSIDHRRTGPKPATSRRTALRQAAGYTRRLAVALWLPAALLLVWYLTSRNSTDIYYVPMQDVWRSVTGTWLSRPVLVDDVLVSVRRLLVGLLISLVIGVTFGYLIGRVRLFREILRPIVDFIRALPGLALVPVFVAIFGPGTKSEVALIVWVCVYPILLNTIDGVAGLDPGFRDAARAIRLRGWRRIVAVELPCASQRILAGFKVSLSLGVIVMVAVELFSAPSGIGRRLFNFQSNFAVRETYGGAVVAGLIGYGLATIVIVLERHVFLRWHTAYQERRPGRSDW